MKSTQIKLTQAPSAPSMAKNAEIGGAGFARDAALRALEALRVSRDKPAVLLTKDWRILGTPYMFEHMEIYQAVATRANCYVVVISRPEAGGVDHFLFLTRTPGLTDADYFACLDESPAPVDEAKIA